MCPDHGLLSAYVDGEVPSPWKERIVAHLESCPACAAAVAKYRDLDTCLASSSFSVRGDPAAWDEAAAVERLRSRLGARLDAKLPSPSAGTVWSRRVSLPLPIAAAAGLALVFTAGLATAGMWKPARASVQSLAAAEIAPSRSEPKTMEALIRYLESQDAQVNLTIQLPAGATFDASGKPLIVKASDFVPLAPSGRAAFPSEKTSGAETVPGLPESTENLPLVADPEGGTR